MSELPALLQCGHSKYANFKMAINMTLKFLVTKTWLSKKKYVCPFQVHAFDESRISSSASAFKPGNLRGIAIVVLLIIRNGRTNDT